MPTIRFLGGAGTVTGSKFMVWTDDAAVLVECGLFQGHKAVKSLNWMELPCRPHAIDAVVLTHAHLDHSGWLPRLAATGYDRRVFCTPGTADLLSIVLPDAGFLQEEEAAHASRKGWSRQQPAKPLYTLLDAQRSLRLLRHVPFGTPREIAPGFHLTFHPAGHIIGSAFAELVVEERLGATRLLFSGDLGRAGGPIMADPATIRDADYIIVESTYGDRIHAPIDPGIELSRVVRAAVRKRGMLVIPAFAIGRTLEVLNLLRELEVSGEIPSLDVFLDSPMAIDATLLAERHRDEFNADAQALLDSGIRLFAPAKLHLVRDAEQSRALNRIRGPAIILSASGMCDGGRVKHHLAQRLPFSRNTIALVGFQAAGTRGRSLAEGAKKVWIFGQEVPVQAQVEKLQGFSAHADQAGVIAWLGQVSHPPRLAFVVHGEPDSSQALAGHIESRLGWRVDIPGLGDEVPLMPTQPARVSAGECTVS
jgi:metallo-beta-lactamase family protein